MANPRIQALLVGAFEYVEANIVSTTITVKLSKAIDIRRAGILLKLTEASQVAPEAAAIKGDPIGHNWHESSSESSSDSDGNHHHFRIFRFNLAQLEVNKHFNYSIVLGKGNKHYDLKFSRLHRANMQVNHSYAKNLPLNSPQALLGEKSDLSFVTGGDQEVIDALDIGGFPLVMSDNRAVTQRLYQAMAKQAPDLFVHLSDVFHGESAFKKQVEKYGDFHEHIEKDFGSVARATLASIPATRILDDHDFGKNNVGPGELDSGDGQNSVRTAINVFNEYWPVSRQVDPNGLYFETQHGDIHCFHLQTRLYQEGNNLLGQTQYNWLKSRLMDEQIKSHIKLIFTPLPFVMGKKPEEDYRRSASYWEDLLVLFAKTGVKGIFCADSHNYSRTEIKVKLEERTVTIPHFIVGTLGGIAQAPTSKEYASMKLSQQGLPPDDYRGDTAAEVKAYYGLKKSYNPFSKFKLIKDGENRTPEELKSERAYGYLKVDVARRQSSSGEEEAGLSQHRRMLTRFFVTPERDLEPRVLDEADYSCSDDEMPVAANP